MSDCLFLSTVGAKHDSFKHCLRFKENNLNSSYYVPRDAHEKGIGDVGCCPRILEKP